MRTYPEDKDDWKYAEELKAEPWMLDCLKLNPEYVHWGPHEDYMWVKGDGWNSPILQDTWKGFDLELDELNEVVHFYFEINRESKKCETCGATGYHPDAHWVQKSWYRHDSPFTIETEMERMVRQGMQEGFGMDLREIHGRGTFPDEATFAKYKPEFRAFCEEMRKGDGFWSDKLIQAEVDILVAEGRLMDWTHTWTQGEGWKEKPGGAKAHTPSAAEVNGEQNNPKPARLSHGHDAINQGICVRARCERFGIPVECLDCKGTAHLYTAPKATLGVVFWLIHPRKGASRWVEVKSIEQHEVKAVYKYLRDAAKRNAERFEKVIAQL